MPTPKQFATNAARQAAYRERHAARRPPTEAQLAILARSLHVVVTEAVEAGLHNLPASLVGEQPDQTLRNLIRYFDPHPDPVREQGKEKL